MDPRKDTTRSLNRRAFMGAGVAATLTAAQRRLFSEFTQFFDTFLDTHKLRGLPSLTQTRGAARPFTPLRGAAGEGYTTPLEKANTTPEKAEDSIRCQKAIIFSVIRTTIKKKIRVPRL